LKSSQGHRLENTVLYISFQPKLIPPRGVVSTFVLDSTVLRGWILVFYNQLKGCYSECSPRKAGNIKTELNIN